MRTITVMIMISMIVFFLGCTAVEETPDVDGIIDPTDIAQVEEAPVEQVIPVKEVPKEETPAEETPVEMAVVFDDDSCGDGVCNDYEKEEICDDTYCLEDLDCPMICSLRCDADCTPTDKPPVCGDGICEGNEGEKICDTTYCEEGNCPEICSLNCDSDCTE